MSRLEVPSWTLGRHLSEVAWGELSVFGGRKAECRPDVSSVFDFKNHQVLTLKH